jgi:hypothetical protein
VVAVQAKIQTAADNAGNVKLRFDRRIPCAATFPLLALFGIVRNIIFIPSELSASFRRRA